MTPVEALARALCEHEAVEFVQDEEELGWAPSAWSEEQRRSYRVKFQAKVRAYFDTKLSHDQKQSYLWMAEKLLRRQAELLLQNDHSDTDKHVQPPTTP